MISEQERWSRNFSGSDFFYGLEPGPVARRTVRYHLPLCAADRSCTALDVGCGEGQDLAFLAASGYDAWGVDFAVPGLNKARRLLQMRGAQASLFESSVLDFEPKRQFDLVLAVNSLQFVGAMAPRALERVQGWVAPGGVLGFSAFAREAEQDRALVDGIYRWTLDELLANFRDWQPFEAARLWQWSGAANEAQPFVTLVARKSGR